MSDEYAQELVAAKDIARQAGVVMLKYFDADKRVQEKTDASPVTIADTEINRLVIEALQKQFDDGIVGEEESTAEYGMGRRWICDPIDGTKGYILGIPTAMFSLGLVVDGIPVLGVTYDPFLDKLYWGVRGEGSFCNDMRLKVSSGDLANEYVALTSSPKRTLQYKDCIETLSQEGARVISFGGSVYKMGMIARGSLVGYIEASVNPHDTVAGHVIVEEAGGMVTDLDGQLLDYTHKFKGAIFSNTHVHEVLVSAAKKIPRE